jgi:hypothetical protein
MKGKIWFPIVFALIVVFPYSLSADRYAQPVNPFEELQCIRFDSLNVRFVGNWPFGWSHIGALAYDSLRNIVFFGSGGGIYILDVSVPSSPRKLSESAHTRGTIWDFYYVYDSQMLFVADGLGGLEIWDVSDPFLPEKLGNWPAQNISTGIFVSGPYAFLTDWDVGLRVIDVSNPSNPQQIGEFKIRNEVFDVFVSDTLAFVACNTMRIFNISIPSVPREISQYTGHPFMTIEDICVKGTYVYAVDGHSDSSSLTIIDVADPTNPQGVSCYGTSSSASCIYVSDSIAYIGDMVSPNPGIFAINISDPLNPYLICHVDSAVSKICIPDSLGYGIAQGCRGLRAMDFSYQGPPNQIGQYEVPMYAKDIKISDNYAFLANSYGGLRVIDVSSSANPFEVAIFKADGDANGIFILDSLAYMTFTLSVYHGALRIVNISNPSYPFQIGSCSIGGVPLQVFVCDSFAYVTYGDFWADESGVRIIDVSNPSNPYEVGSYHSIWRSAGDVFVRDSLAFLVIGDMHILNISIPSLPIMIGYCQTEACAQAIDLSSEYAYIVDGNIGQGTGLRIIDISDPRNPFEVGFHETDGNISDCFLNEPYVYVADGIQGIRVIDVTSPSSPFEVGYYVTPDNALSIDATENTAYIACDPCGLQIYEFMGAGVEEKPSRDALSSSIRILQNPVKSNYIYLVLTSPKTSNIEISLYNQIGQEFNTYQFNGLKSGENRLGLDAAGLPAGIYFLKLNGKPVGKVVKVR